VRLASSAAAAVFSRETRMTAFDAPVPTPAGFKPGHHAPQRSAVIAMWIFLASLAMLFIASMLGYLLFRFTGKLNPPLGTLQFPFALWISTLVVLAASVTLQNAVTAVRRERHESLRRWLWISLALALAFVLIQAPSMWTLLSNHSARAAGAHTLYGMIFFLILLHALHVLGGVIALVVVIVRAARSHYDHESHLGVRFTALYWHFLDVVWLVMFGTMFLFG
jgi:heme/copper-type cytochrome/quinol oxidase subunit 3